MANTALLLYTPLVGASNLLTFTDPDFPGVEKAAVVTSMGSLSNDYILKTSLGDGAVPSIMVADPQGRPGSLRTSLHVICVDDADLDGEYIDIYLEIPPGVRGAAPDGISPAAYQNTAFWPHIDPSQFLPRVIVAPQYSPFAYQIAGAGASTGDLQLQSVTWAPGAQITAGATGYIPPSETSATILALPFVSSFVYPGQYGVIAVRVSFATSPPATPFTGGHAFLIDIDFSASVAN